MSAEYISKSGRTVERMASSRNGNPRFRVTFADGTTYSTAPDASCAYGIENRELDGEVRILLNGRGHIVDIRPAIEPKPTADRPTWATRTWADGFGVWHVRVAHTVSSPIIAARKALRDELVPREANLARSVWLNPVRVPDMDSADGIVYREGTADGTPRFVARGKVVWAPETGWTDDGPVIG